MKKLMNFTLKNTFVIFLVIVMLIGGGVYSTKNIKMETMPDITIPVITTVTIYPGASPEDVAEKITEPMQKSISGIQGVDTVKTMNNENIGIIITQFNYNTDMDKAEKNVTDAVNKITLPDDAQKPTISRVGFGSMPVITYAVAGTMDKEKLTKYINDKVSPKLSGISGVSSISVQGTADNSEYIKVDSSKLKKYGLSMDDVKSALTGNNISYPVGQADINGKTLPIRTEKRISSIDELKSIPIVVPINTTSVMGDSLKQMGEGMTQLGKSVQQLGEGMGEMSQQVSQGMGQLAQSQAQIGGLVGSNTQAIAYLNGIQQIQMGIMSQQAVLTNPLTTAAQKKQASTVLTQLQKQLKQSQDALNKTLNDEMKKGKSMQSSSKNTAKSSNSSAAKNGKALNANSSKQSSSSSARGKSIDKIKVKVVFLGDVAKITSSSSENELKTRTNLKDGVILSVYKSDDGNTVQVSNAVKNAIEELHKDNSACKFSIISDSSVNIKNSVNGMIREGVLGALFAIIVIALFLRDLRATVIAVISIPLSILIALILMPRLGITLNIMSLGGIAVAVGRIVDDSIVVIENIYRRFSQDENRDEELIKDAAAEVGSAIMSSTITTVGVFLPLSFITGIVGKVFYSFAVTVVICILASLLVAIVVVPVLSKKMILGRKIKFVEHEGRIVIIYRRILSAALDHRMAVIGIALVLFVGSIFLAAKIPTQFLPSESTNILSGDLTMSSGTSEEVTNKYALKFEKYLHEREDIETVSSSVGDTSSSGNSLTSMQGSNGASFTVVIKQGKNYDKVAEEISKEAEKLSDKKAKFKIATQSATGQSENVEVDLYSDKEKDLDKASDLVLQKLKNFKELTNVMSSVSEKKPEIEIKVDEKKAAQNGLTSLMVAGMVRSNLNSDMVTTISNDNEDTNVYLGYKDKKLNSVNSIKNFKITGMKGTIKLSDVARVSKGYGPVTVTGLDGKRYVAVTADIKSKDTGKVSKEVIKAVDNLKNKLPKSVTYSSGGSKQQIDDAFSQMGMAILVAIALVYVIMVLTFGEGRTPFAILFSLPFAAIGAILGLLITGQSLSVSGMIGMLMLIGIVVTNAIVLLDRVKHNRASGMNVRQALIEAGGVRLRPILMTAIATIMALVPLALGFSEGALISQGLGIVVIGGLLVSTILTLIVVPVIYSIIQREKI
ncbi:efflux RND transporter permease subunit [Clostridium oryzae]|uniref:Swarming motility protein SwrC n=1 Tax=Clostridium oryzae TaxID=1450648 RepID=A0A1V4IV76_9CLOT|nr:efflux RND transporter permease subunit [Clostridium oryzae]OPJ63958.1 swarming motility protein SwrC [Clostridium oryzae]